jgi:hypothetical protein
LPVQGTAESILVGFREDLIEIVSYSAETYCISVQVINKKKLLLPGNLWLFMAQLMQNLSWSSLHS